MKKYKYCQSCGMPIKKDESKGTEADGSKALKYCKYCYENGKFIDETMTFDQMIEKATKAMQEKGYGKFVIKMFTKNAHKLERWTSK